MCLLYAVKNNRFPIIFLLRFKLLNIFKWSVENLAEHITIYSAFGTLTQNNNRFLSYINLNFCTFKSTAWNLIWIQSCYLKLLKYWNYIVYVYILLLKRSKCSATYKIYCATAELIAVLSDQCSCGVLWFFVDLI